MFLAYFIVPLHLLSSQESRQTAVVRQKQSEYRIADIDGKCSCYQMRADPSTNTEYTQAFLVRLLDLPIINLLFMLLFACPDCSWLKPNSALENH
ncbi:hypothetical protein IWX46DRAFT_162264 [Phyllosticta citricarpa]|uniref:Uncharacterized protein n=1 Tax=Phyllosticta citricarpa TaxID=55181 RepID=A0ABR1M5S1_9PEZI